MDKLKHKVLIIIILTSNYCFSQYTDVINSNRPGESMSAFAVGKSIFQVETGFFGVKEKHSYLLTDMLGGGTDFVVRYGCWKENFEVITNIQYKMDIVTTPLEQFNRNGLSKLVLGAKYLIYDPHKNADLDKPNLLSWKKNNSFKFRDILPAVALYVGANINFFNNPYLFVSENVISPKIMLITQNQLPWSQTLTLNAFMDKIGTLNPMKGYVATYSKGLNDYWSIFLEGRGYQSDYYVDNVAAIGVAHLLGKNMQIDFQVSKNFKNTPDIITASVGFSWRFDDNYQELAYRAVKKETKEEKAARKKQEKADQVAEKLERKQNMLKKSSVKSSTKSKIQTTKSSTKKKK